MSSASSTEFKELVRSRTDLVELIGESLSLRPERGGRLFKGLCPFHDDHNPSFQVNSERQSYRCWVCNEGGDCFSFVMKRENVAFPEALELLAKRAGIELPKSARFPGETPAEKSPLYDVLKWADRQLHDFLKQSAPAERARRYLESRGFTPETVEKFRLGYHPEASDWLVQRASGQFTSEQLESARLIRKNEFGAGYWGEFRDRVMFPICDERGRTVAFGGRILPDSSVTTNAKYYNSRESAVFPKSRLVYGLNWAREAIRQTGFAVVVEGYADCVKLHQAGVGNTLATLGTSLTETQVSVMKRFSPRIVLLYDGDDAGIRASRRAVTLFLAQDIDLRVLTLPDQLDPDEYIEAHGTAALHQLIAEAPEAWEFMYQQLTAEHGLGSVHSRLQILDGLLDLLTASPLLEDSAKESLLLASVPRRLGLSETDVRKRLGELRRDRRQAAARRNSFPGGDHPGVSPRAAGLAALQRNSTADEQAECEIFQILFTDPRMMQVFQEGIGPDDFQHELLQELWGICLDFSEEGEPPAFERVLTRIDCPDLKRLVVWLDETARRMDVAGMLSAGSSANCGPDLVESVLQRFRWRREKARHQPALLNWSSAPKDGLQDADKDWLRQRATPYHQQRSSK